MRFTEDFNAFSNKVKSTAFADVYDLWHAVCNIGSKGCFECFQSDLNGQYYVKCTYYLETLRLIDEATRLYFLEQLEKELLKGFGAIPSFKQFSSMG